MGVTGAAIGAHPVAAFALPLASRCLRSRPPDARLGRQAEATAPPSQTIPSGAKQKRAPDPWEQVGKEGCRLAHLAAADRSSLGRAGEGGRSRPRPSAAPPQRRCTPPELSLGAVPHEQLFLRASTACKASAPSRRSCLAALAPNGIFTLGASLPFGAASREHTPALKLRSVRPGG